MKLFKAPQLILIFSGASSQRNNYVTENIRTPRIAGDSDACSQAVTPDQGPHP